MTKIKLEILTPERMVFDQEVDRVSLPGSSGRLGILSDHTGLITKLDFGVLSYANGSKTDEVLCGKGLAEVNHNKVTIIVRSAETSGKIDVDRAKSAYQRAKSHLHSKDDGLDSVRAEAALKRAMVRLRFSKSN